MVSVRSSVRDTQGRSRVPELGPLGSMRGASSNGRPYREREIYDVEFIQCFRCISEVQNAAWQMVKISTSASRTQ